MRKILVLLSFISAISIISACSGEEDPNTLKIGKASDEIIGDNYQTVIFELEEAGFTDVKTEVMEDLITGWLTKDGEIEKIEVDGDTDFSADESFQKDSPIVITYHTFPKEDENAAESTSNTEDIESPESAEPPTEDEPVESNDEILTIENNEELTSILAIKDENDPIIAEFATKYAGRTIELDGYIAYMVQHENYDTRFNFLIYAGDYREENFSGPVFKIENVNVMELNLMGSEIPDYLSMGQNLRITAVIEEYNESSGLFFLDPVTTEIR